MLNQIGLSNTYLCYILLQLRYHIQLMITGEYQLLGILHDVSHLLLCLGFIIVEQHIVHDNVCHYIFLQDMFPHVTGLIPIGIHRVSSPLSFSQSLVEGHEESLVQIQSGSEEHLILIQREVSQAASILHQGFLRVPVFSVLLLPIISCSLMCPGILQFKCEQGNTIHIEHHVQLFAWLQHSICLLTSQRELVLPVLHMRLCTVSSTGLGEEEA